MKMKGLTKQLKGISLFSSSGIGELGMKASGIEIIAANELLSNRCKLYSTNYPETKMFDGDVWSLKEDMIKFCKEELGDDELFLAYATPPCQGMSTNGAGKLKSEIAAGRRPKIDERNRLVIPGMDIISELKPRWVLFENVPAMRDTVISVDDEPWNIIDYIKHRLGPDYEGGATVVTCSDYGIPQLRKRLITVFTRDEDGKKYLKRHNNSILNEEDKKPTKSLWDAIGHLPPLNAVEGENEAPGFHPLHRVNVMGKDKHWWISQTPPGETAYNNQCVNPECLYQGNGRHIDKMENGRSFSSKETPIYCEKCGKLLPRPTMLDKKTGERRLISGFHSAYRRMDATKPSRTLTMNFPFEASDNKVHPTQNRVLSIYEALVIQTIADYDYKWEIDGKPVNKSLIVHSIGESVPPKLIELITSKMEAIHCGDMQVQTAPELTQVSLLREEAVAQA